MTQTWTSESRVDVGATPLMVRQAGDPEGTALVYFHGTPSCRLEPAFADDLCAELGVRLISFDRPGYGDSPSRPFSLASIARDTGTLADALGVERFVTTGQSGGGPFSLACAATLGERVIRAGVTAGPAPFQEMPGLLDELDEIDTLAVSLLPDQNAAARQFAVGFEPFRSLGQAPDEQIITAFKEMASPRDGELLDRPELGTPLAAAIRDAMPQGTSGGGWDNVAWVGPWDFDLDAIRQPVHLWYGGEDTFCPAGTGEWLDARLPSATLVMRPGDGHLGVMEHAREVLETLVSE
jgi:pimeloyl-ACP methyl ester carboxylesterase